MWQLDIQKVQFEGFQRSAREKALAASRCLQVRAAKHLRQEEAASARRAQSQRLRARSVPAVLMGMPSWCSSRKPAGQRPALTSLQTLP